MSEQLALQFTESLPRKPWATDDFTYGLRVQPLAGAIQRRYIQHNQPALVCWMVFDIDRPAGALAWEDVGLPAPFWVATNPANGHAHICYGLSAPVCRSDAAKAAPLRLTAAIEAALCDRLQADVGYAGLVCKNPLHKHWRVQWFGGGPYELGYLAEWCGDLKRYSDRRRRWADYGLGRNVTLFHNLRQWAYAAVRDFWRPDGATAWQNAVLARCEALNGQFTNPLPEQELKAIAKSVARWVWQRFSPAELRALIERTHTPEIQAKRGRKGGQRSGAARREGSLTEAQPWIELGISRATWYRRHR